MQYGINAQPCHRKDHDLDHRIRSTEIHHDGADDVLRAGQRFCIIGVEGRDHTFTRARGERGEGDGCHHQTRQPRDHHITTHTFAAV